MVHEPQDWKDGIGGRGTEVKRTGYAGLGIDQWRGGCEASG